MTVRSSRAVTSTSSLSEESNPISVRLMSFITIMSTTLALELRSGALHPPGAMLGGKPDQHLSAVRLDPSSLRISVVGSSVTCHGSPDLGRLPV